MIGVSIHQHDWSVVESWFMRRAQEAVERGEISNVYQHQEVVSAPSAVDPQIGESARQLGEAAGRSIAALLKANE